MTEFKEAFCSETVEELRVTYSTDTGDDAAMAMGTYGFLPLSTLDFFSHVNEVCTKLKAYSPGNTNYQLHCNFCT